MAGEQGFKSQLINVLSEEWKGKKVIEELLYEYQQQEQKDLNENFLDADWYGGKTIDGSPENSNSKEVLKTLFSKWTSQGAVTVNGINHLKYEVDTAQGKQTAYISPRGGSHIRNEFRGQVFIDFADKYPQMSIELYMKKYYLRNSLAMNIWADCENNSLEISDILALNLADVVVNSMDKDKDGIYLVDETIDYTSYVTKFIDEKVAKLNDIGLNVDSYLPVLLEDPDCFNTLKTNKEAFERLSEDGLDHKVFIKEAIKNPKIIDNFLACKVGLNKVQQDIKTNRMTLININKDNILKGIAACIDYAGKNEGFKGIIVTALESDDPNGIYKLAFAESIENGVPPEQALEVFGDSEFSKVIDFLNRARKEAIKEIFNDKQFRNRIKEMGFETDKNIDTQRAFEIAKNKGIVLEEALRVLSEPELAQKLLQNENKADEEIKEFFKEQQKKVLDEIALKNVNDRTASAKIAIDWLVNAKLETNSGITEDEIKKQYFESPNQQGINLSYAINYLDAKRDKEGQKLSLHPCGEGNQYPVMRQLAENPKLTKFIALMAKSDLAISGDLIKTVFDMISDTNKQDKFLENFSQLYQNQEFDLKASKETFVSNALKYADIVASSDKPNLDQEQTFKRLLRGENVEQINNNDIIAILTPENIDNFSHNSQVLKTLAIPLNLQNLVLLAGVEGKLFVDTSSLQVVSQLEKLKSSLSGVDKEIDQLSSKFYQHATSNSTDRIMMNKDDIAALDRIGKKCTKHTLKESFNLLAFRLLPKAICHNKFRETKTAIDKESTWQKLSDQIKPIISASSEVDCPNSRGT
ncbi:MULTISPECIES: hypothetical protein [Cysteiniphilum]|uniref:hypothetical protein n=1 Tax=Cysteiniphilum TaxID=2056696 RepID=UPI00178457BE|nr:MULTISPECIES: hypothetical protein [Cysteiniphilum]